MCDHLPKPLQPMAQALDAVWLKDTKFVAGDHISIAGEH
jgi:hypothetical protein